MSLALDERLDNLVGHLAAYDLGLDHLVEQVSDDYGRQLLVVATGSVLMGWANPHSDLDVDVVTDGEDLIQLPIMSFRQGARIDVLYFSSDQWYERLGRARDDAWPPPAALRTTWVKMYRSLSNISRFALGYPLVCEPEFREPFAGLQDGWLERRLETWWQVEAVRRWIVSEAYLPHHWMVAAGRYWDAVTAAISAIAARQGQTNMSSKWLPQKLALLGEHELLDILRRAVTFPTEAELPAYREMTRDLMVRAGCAPGSLDVEVELWPADGVAGHRVGDGRLVSRWDLRTLHFRRSDLEVVPGEPLWAGPPDAPLPPEVERLLVEDMLWVGLRSPR